jgi:thioredoxin 1
MGRTFDTPLITSDQSIDRVLNAGLPVLLVFLNQPGGDGFRPALEQIAKTYAGQVLVVQTTPSDSPQAAHRYQVSGSPALVAIKNGQVQSKSEQIAPAELESHAKYLLGKGPRPEAKSQASSSGATGSAYSSSSTSTGGHPVTVTDATFEQEVMGSPVPVVVDFWAPWCGPCRMVSPTLEKLAVEWNGRVKIAKVNVDENPRIAATYGIQSIPTMMVVKNGKIAERWAGALPEPALRSRLSAFIG